MPYRYTEPFDLTDAHLRLLRRAFYRETETALQIVLAVGEFATGRYRKRDRYDNRSWERIS